MQTTEATGARIRQLREAAGLTQQALATKLGCSQPHIANIERGHSPVSDEHRAALAALFGDDELAVAS